MSRLAKVCLTGLCWIFAVAFSAEAAQLTDGWPYPSIIRIAAGSQNPQDPQPGQNPPDAQPSQNPQGDQQTKEERKRKRREGQKNDGQQPADTSDDTATPQNKNKSGNAKISTEFGDTVEITADTQSKLGDTFVYEGYVNATLGEIRLQADHVNFNSVTGDMTAEGNVIFDQGADQRVTARRAELNWKTRRGTFWETTGFTNRTQTGEYIFYTASRVEKTGQTTYELYEADVTACEDVIPKWSFHAHRAELKMDDRITMHNAVFHVRVLPVFVLPYAWIPATRKERKSGFLLPSTGTSTQKGRTLKLAYYQTLGDSADVTFTGDVYTQRGLGFGAAFRAQTDEKSYMHLGFFTVKDRLFGPTGDNQGGTAFIGEGQQYLPHGWVLVGNVSLTSSLAFRQVFSDDISQVIDPRRESTFYAYNNTRNFSFGVLTSNETTTLFRPSRILPEVGGGSNIDVKIRQAPEIDMSSYPRRIFSNLPIYFSFDSSLAALKRQETDDSDNVDVFVTPAAVQRFDFQPKVTIPLATIAGIAITPSLSFRETYYSNSIDPNIQLFDPDRFATSLTDPRLDPANPAFDPSVRLFDRATQDPVLPNSLSRHYTELTVDIRPPSLEKTYTEDDGTPRFKHVIEPYITYRLIRGIGDKFNDMLRFDERDAVANTNEFEYAVVNRFFSQRSASDVNRRRRRRRGVNPGTVMKPVTPDSRDVNGKKKNKQTSPSPDDQNNPQKPTAGSNAEPKAPDTATAPAANPATEPTANPATAPANPGQPVTPAEPASSDKTTTPETQSIAPPATPPADQQQPANPANPPQDQTANPQKGKPKDLEKGTQTDLNRGGVPRSQTTDTSTNSNYSNKRKKGDTDDTDATQAQNAATDADSVTQAYEFLTLKVAQKYFIDRTFGHALVEGRRNQFYPINTLSGFTFGGVERSFSPVNVSMRYRPLSLVFADLRMDVGSEDGLVRDVVVGGGFVMEKFSFSTNYYLSRRIQVAPNSFEPGTFAGNQWDIGMDFGNGIRGWYGGTRISYDFTDEFDTPGVISKGRLSRSRSYFGRAWDCCGVQLNYNTFKAGLRNESAFSVTFTLAGIGSLGTDQVGGGGTSRKANKRSGGFNDF